MPLKRFHLSQVLRHSLNSGPDTRHPGTHDSGTKTQEPGTWDAGPGTLEFGTLIPGTLEMGPWDPEASN